MKTNHFTTRNLSKIKGQFRLNMTAWLAILVMSIAGIIAVFLHNFKNPQAPPVVTKPVADITSSKDPVTVEYKADITTIASQCKQMVSRENSFVIYEYGTCVRLMEPVTNHIEAANSSLKILASPNLSFTVKPLNNNNYLIVFNDYLFCWLFAKDIAHLKESLLTDSRLMPSSKDPESISDYSEFDQRLGKFARLLMIKDSETLVIKNILKAKPSTSTSPPTSSQ